MTDFVTINSIEQLDERHATELEHLEAKLKRLQIAKKAAKKERESMKKKHEDEKAKLLFSEDDQIELEKLDLRFGFILRTLFYPFSSQEEPSEDTQTQNKTEENKNEDQKISKTEKRRRKKEAEEKAKQERIKAALKESEEKFLRGEMTPKIIEQNSIQECSRINPRLRFHLNFS